MQSQKNITILHSNISVNAGPDEQDTLEQVKIIGITLEKLGYRISTLPFNLDTPELTKNLQRQNPNLVFNLVESIDGRGDLIHLAPTLLENLKIPYTGGNTQALLTSSNKILTKRLLQNTNIPTPTWLELTDLNTQKTSDTYIVKSVIEEGSLGIDKNSVADNHQALIKIINDKQKQFGGKWFAEKYIAGREFNIAVLASAKDPQVLPIAEIQFIDFPNNQPHIVDYSAKWHSDSTEYHNTTRTFNFSNRDEELLTKLKQLALTCWDVFELSGYARVDVRVDAQENPWVLELNVNPCLTPDAGFIAAAEEANLNYENVIMRIVEDALRRQYKND